MNEQGFAPYEPQTDMAPRLCDVLNYGYDLRLNDYPIFDEEYRAELNQKIVDHFYTREISAPTPGMFIYWLNRQLNERMPQINKVYEALRNLDPFLTAEATSETHSTSANSSDESSTGKQSSGSTAYASNAPQVSMVGKDEVDYYDTGNRTGTSAETEAASTSAGTGSNDSTSRQTARTGALPDLIAAWYDGYNSGDLLVFEALEPCFTHVFDFGGYW